MAADLTAGALATLLQGGTVDKPIFQILGIKKIGQNDRYRLHISDGEQASSFAMLATQLNEIVDSGKLDTYAVFRVENQICNHVPPDKRVLVILDLTILTPGSVVGREIGNPKLIKPQATPAPPQATPAQPQTSGSFYAGMQQAAAAKSKMAIKTENPEEIKKPRLHGGEHVVTIPIVALTPYQNRWTIRARVVNKSAIRTWSNSRGEGKLFSVDFKDESSDIRATCFNEQCDAFYNKLEISKVYYISRGSLSPANRQFNKLRSEYEIKFNSETTILPCLDDVSELPAITHEFVPIAKLMQYDKDSIIDVIGIVKRFGDLQTIVSRTTNKEFDKRDLVLVDTSNAEVSLTIWGQEAQKFDGSSNPVVAVKGAKLSDFGGCSLSAMNSSLVQIDPDIEEVRVLKKWFQEIGCNSTAESLTRGTGSAGVNAVWKCLRQVKLDSLGTGNVDYFSLKCAIVYVRQSNCLYKACPSQQCNKKVVDYNGRYRCEKCNQEFDKFKWRVLMSLKLADATGSIWVTAFQESVEFLTGKTSAELGDLMESDEDTYRKVLDSIVFKSYIFRIRSKEESYNDEKRVQSTVVSVSPINYLEYNKKLIADFKKL